MKIKFKTPLTPQQVYERLLLRIRRAKENGTGFLVSAEEADLLAVKLSNEINSVEPPRPA